MENFKNTFEYKLIYIFRINDERHRGLVKIGDASVDAKNWKDLSPNCPTLNKAAIKRINQYSTTIAASYELLHTEIAVYKNKKNELKAFRDYDVSAVLTASGIKKKDFDDLKGKPLEWYETDLSTAINAIKAVKENRHSLYGKEISRDRNPIIFRPDQIKAIEQSVQYLQKGARMLWNAKMRFGKTLCALEVVKRIQFKRTIILTHRPVVNEGWFEDFDKIFYDTNYKFGSKKNGLSFQNLIKESENFVYFASIQDLRGSKKVGGHFNKNDEVFSIDWDFVVIDEAHEGTLTDLGTAVLENIIKRKDETESKTLMLSGTPFNIIDEFTEKNQVFTWDYVMEQKAKQEWWSKYGDNRNPYDELPDMKIYTYNLNKVFRNSSYIDLEDKAFNFKEFFRVWTGDIEKDFKRVPENKKIGDFVHEEDIISFLNLLTKKDDESNYPYSTEEYRDYFKHSLWMLPGVKEAAALSKLLKNHPVFGSSAFKIVNVAGDGDLEEESADALTKVKKAIKEAGDSGYTITLSCGKLTTGVTIKEWSNVLMLAGSYATSPSSYLQTIFRVQSPGNVNGKIKEHCYVFDFAPDRTLKVAAAATRLSYKAGETTDQDRIVLGEFLNFCPVIGIEGSNMIYYSPNSLLQQLKKIEIDKVVSSGFEDAKLYNKDFKLSNDEIKKFNNLKAIIGTTKQTKKQKEVEVNSQGLTNEEYEELKRIQKKKKNELTPEEKALLEKHKEESKQRQTAISILRGISIRIPLMIYGADVKDNETITIDNFVEKVDDASWKEFMPNGVTKTIFNDFKKYYDKDIFEACGKKIRNSVKNADALPPKERIIRLAEIFSQFKNPDKETVLTPWRVVNMHIGDCIGGYNFYNQDYSEMIEEPRVINHGKVTNDVFNNPQVKILEINSKTGLYPLYMTYSIYRNKLNSPLATNKDYWRETVEKNIFVLCKTKMAKKITQRTLVGFKDYKANIYVEENIIYKLKTKNEQLISELSNAITWNMNDKTMEGKMNFEAIVGNPPYQVMDGGNGSSSIPVYNNFVKLGITLQPSYVSMIMPSRWFSGGKGLDDFRKMMLSNKNIRKLHDFMNSSECFKSASIEGGVCYFLYDKNTIGECEYVLHQADGSIIRSKRYLQQNEKIDVLIRDEKQLKILNKVLNKTEKYFSEIVYPRNPFGINEVEDKFFTTKEMSTYSVLGRFNNKREVKYVNSQLTISKNKELLSKYKIFISKADGAAGQIGNPIPAKILGRPEFGDINEFCTETFLAVGPFNNQEEVHNVIEYMQTKFFRFMVGLRKNKNMTQDTYNYVPLLDFKEKWNDKKLYELYQLNQEDIIYIEKMIKSTE